MSSILIALGIEFHSASTLGRGEENLGEYVPRTEEASLMVEPIYSQSL